MKKIILYIVPVILILVGQACKQQEAQKKVEHEPAACLYLSVPTACFYFENESKYSVSVRGYRKSNLPDGEDLLLNKKGYIPPGETTEVDVSFGGCRDANESLIPYCAFNRNEEIDSLCIYFDKGSSSEKYVSYTRKGFKPRDIRNIEEYEYEKGFFRFYYTFTNKDYENAAKHQNAASTPTLMPTPKNQDKSICYEVCPESE